MKAYQIEYWFLSFPEECYDYRIVDVEAISPKQAILKAKLKAHKGAKAFQII